MSDIFLSYASADRERVRPLVKALQDQGWSVWWDRTIPPGKTWAQVIEEELDKSRCVIVLWSKTSVRSDWVKSEAEEGRKRRILIPALLDEVTIPLAFRSLQAADLSRWSGSLKEEIFLQLANAIEDRLSPVVSAAYADPDPSTFGAWYQGNFLAQALQSRQTIVAIGLILAIVLAGLKVYSTLSRTLTKGGLEYMWIPPGKFMMGCPPTEDCDENSPFREVAVPIGFWIGKTEVPQSAYNGSRDVLKPSALSLPAVGLDWHEAQAYCAAVGLRLPTEAEWEYAARAGSKGSRYASIEEAAWYRGNSHGSRHQVGLKRPNEWGLHDMLGNVSEWVADRYQEDDRLDTSGKRVVRGGSWYDSPRSIQAWYRIGAEATDRSEYRGFRCAGDIPNPD